MGKMSKSVFKSFIQWEIAVAKFSVVIGTILGIVLFVFGNTLGQTVTDDSVGVLEAILYLLRTTLALFLFGSLLNVFFQTAGFITSLLQRVKKGSK